MSHRVSGPPFLTITHPVTVSRPLSPPDLPALHLPQSLFEGSMYIFVFMWTPALSPSGGTHGTGADGTADPPPYGQMFATFMLCCMCGSSIYSILCKYATRRCRRRCCRASACAHPRGASPAASSRFSSSLQPGRLLALAQSPHLPPLSLVHTYTHPSPAHSTPWST